MSCVSGTNVVNDGLVFHYDMSNTVKSWKGAPVTNLLTGAGTTNLGNGAFLSGAGTRTDLGGGRYRFDITQQVIFRMYCNLSTLTNGQTYGCSLKFEENTCVVLVLDWCDTSVTTGINSVAGLISGKLYGIATRGGYSTTYRFLDINIGPGTVILSEAQVDSISISTPFVNGTRSNTEAIIDLTGENVITASNLSYNSDGTINFDGTDDIITAPVVGRSASAVTISAMVKVDTHGNWNTFVNNGWVANGWILYSSSTGWVFGVANASSAQFNASSLHNSSVDWTHLVGVYDGSFVRLYVNGELKSSTAFVTSTMRTIGNIHIGYGNVLGLTEKRIDKVKLYNRALSATEIKQNFEATRSIYGI
jgi:hypothetical protein